METAEDEPGTFEMGPIRPPNEASSLLVRVSRNCPWNRCTFCPVYEGQKFSLRDPECVETDIRAMAAMAARIRDRLGDPSQATSTQLRDAVRAESTHEAVQIVRFLAAGGETAFLQDANSLIVPVDDLERILRFLKRGFPSLRRVTTYARSHTITKRSVEELRRLRDAGLDRVHIGLESGSDRVLALVDKGVTADRHIDAGLRVKASGLELSEYVMPGLGGRALSADHATETARVLRAIDPHFIRLRTLAVYPGSALEAQQRRGEFEPLDDVGIARELRDLLSGLGENTGVVQSDHNLNLLEEVAGKLPDDLPAMLSVLDRFLAFEPDRRDAFIVGRRLGILHALRDLDSPDRLAQAEQALGEIRRRFPGPLQEALRRLRGMAI